MRSASSQYKISPFYDLFALCITIWAGLQGEISFGGPLDLRPFRSVNHIVMTARLLESSQQCQDLVYAEGEKKYCIQEWGTGTAVSEDGFFLTNYHIAKDAAFVFIGGWKASSSLIHAKLVRTDEKDDLASLKVDPPEKLSYINRFSSTESLVESEEVFVWAYLRVPDGFMQFLRHGIVSNNTPIEGTKRLIYIESSAAWGTSVVLHK